MHGTSSALPIKVDWDKLHLASCSFTLVPHEISFYCMEYLLMINSIRFVNLNRSIRLPVALTAATQSSEHPLAAIGISARGTRTYISQ